MTANGFGTETLSHMPTLPTLAVTGSTGALGGLVARELADLGVAQRLVVRSPERAPRLDRADAVRAAYGDREAALRSLEGATTLFMVSAAEAADRLEQHLTFVDAAADAGVEHVVYTSFFGAAADCTFTLGRDHWATEEHIRARGMQFTFLRDNLYLDFFPHLVGDDGVIRGPAGAGAGLRGRPARTSHGWPSTSCSTRRRTSGRPTTSPAERR